VSQPRLIHADAVAGNLIDGPGGVTLIDWQCPASGDPTEDLATFLSPAMQWLYRGRVLSPQETEAFLAAYPDPAVTDRYLRLQPLYRWRMAAHCLWKADRGAPDYEKALAAELAS
jgi:thiamine kinase-like enzyme